MTHWHQKKLAVINDFSGFGHCSIAVALPVISALGLQCCPVPTSVFSNHTGYSDYFFVDFTEQIRPYLETWAALGLTFDGVYTGFLGSKRQANLVRELLPGLSGPETKVIVDPVMGDHGKAYRTCTPELCRSMTELVRAADIITPNLTECCILTGQDYRQDFSDSQLLDLAGRLQQLGPKGVVITGVPAGNLLRNVILDGSHSEIQCVTRIGGGRCGTGDIFASIVAANAVKNIPLADSVRQASSFISHCIRRSEDMDLPPVDGVCFEECLGELTAAARTE